MDYVMLTGAKTTAGSIASWLNYGLAPADVLLTEAQALIYQTLRVREMMTTGTVTLAAGAQAVALPTGFQDPIGLWNRFNIRMKYRDAGSLQSKRTVDGNLAILQSDPSTYAIFDEKLQFNCQADTAVTYTYTLIHFATPAALSVGNPTNFLTTRYPLLLRTALVALAADFRQDDAVYQRNVQRLAQLITDINAKDDLYLRDVVVDPDYTTI